MNKLEMQKAHRTLNTQKYINAVSIKFKNYLKFNNIHNFKSKTISEQDEIISSFFFELKKVNKENYKITSIRALAGALNMYFRDTDYLSHINILDKNKMKKNI